MQLSQISSVMAVAAQEAEHGGGQSLAAEVVLRLGPLEISSHILSAWLVMAVLVIVSVMATRSMKLVPTGLQNFMEVIVELLVNLIQETAGAKGRIFAPVVMTAFLFILTSNWMGTLPIYEHIHVLDPIHHEEAALLKSSNSSLNVTASMAIIVFVLCQFYAIRTLGFVGYLKEFAIPNPLHILTELSRPLSLSLRLFGNIFAGGVLVHTMLGIAPFITFVFLGLELFVGAVQALIFTMLTLVFLSIANTGHGHDPHDPSHTNETQEEEYAEARHAGARQAHH